MTDFRSPTPPAPGIARRFLSFETMIAPSLIRFIYFAGLVCIAVSAVIMLFGGLAALRYSVASGIGTIIMAGVVTVLGTVIWRFYCELMILLFRIYDRLTEIRDQGAMR